MGMLLSFLKIVAMLLFAPALLVLSAAIVAMGGEYPEDLPVDE